MRQNGLDVDTVVRIDNEHSEEQVSSQLALLRILAQGSLEFVVREAELWGERRRDSGNLQWSALSLWAVNRAHLLRGRNRAVLQCTFTNPCFPNRAHLQSFKTFSVERIRKSLILNGAHFLSQTSSNLIERAYF